ncbi:MAG: hypothetical protein IKV29_01815 [Alistipes sp.]|nr:hypothetical protein [Alistipes sp.]
MELLTNIITGYLKHNKRLVVPRFGAFIVKQPAGDIIFSELMRNDDGVLRSLLVAYGCNEIAANGIIDRFVFEIRHKVAEGGSYSIPNFGEFLEGENNTIRFRQKREPKVFGGKIKPPIECFDEEKMKLQRIQRIRQQQCENLTGHSTHRKLKTSHAITTNNQRVADEEDIDLGKPDKYLRGLKYENRKGRGNDDESFSNERPTANGSAGRIIAMLIVAILIGIAIWFTWRWIETNNATHSTTPVVDESEVTVEAQDSLASTETPEATSETEATTTTPQSTQPATVNPMMVTPLLPTTYTTPATGITPTTGNAQ